MAAVDNTASLKHLSQRHDDYCADKWREYTALAEGGDKLYKDHALLRELLPPGVGEHPIRHRDRIRNATYINHFGKIVNFFATAVFEQQLTVLAQNGEGDNLSEVDDIYAAFQRDADREGRRFTECLHRLLCDALVNKRAVVCVDFPTADEPRALNRLQEEESGEPPPYLVRKDPQELINWDKSTDGTLRFAVLHRKRKTRPSPFLKPQVHDEYKVWMRDDTTGKVVWQLFETERVDAEGQKDTEEAREQRAETARQVAGWRGSGTEGVTTFKRVPVLVLEMPEVLWLGKQLAPLAREHFQRRTGLRTAIARNLYAIPWVKLGSDVPEAGGSIKTEEGDGKTLAASLNAKGFVVLGENDDLGFAEPSGAAYKLEAELLQELVDEMYRVGEQTANSLAMTKTGIYRSGASKQEDRAGTSLVLSKIADKVRLWAEEILRTISEARNDKVTWVAKGVDDFTMWDRKVTLEEAVAVSQMSIPSKTFHASYTKELAARLLKKPTPELVELIADEVRDHFEKNGPPDPQAAEKEKLELEREKVSQGGEIEREKIAASKEASKEAAKARAQSGPPKKASPKKENR